MALPLHRILLHPRTGLPLRAVGLRRDGRPIWPVLGAAPDDDDDDDGDGDKDDDAKLGDAGTAALRKERQRAAKAEKALKEAQAKLQEANDRDKSEVDKAKDAAAAAERRAEEAERKLLRAEVAADKGLTPGQAKRLVGDSREELEADADELLESFGKAGAKPDDDGDDGKTKGSRPGAKPAGKPKEKLAPGEVPDRKDDDEDDMSKVADEVFRSSRGGL
jgi:hypothetical protein